jgi:hypothetical protein
LWTGNLRGSFWLYALHLQIAAFELLESLRTEAVPIMGGPKEVTADVGGMPVAAHIN